MFLSINNSMFYVSFCMFWLRVANQIAPLGTLKTFQFKREVRRTRRAQQYGLSCYTDLSLPSVRQGISGLLGPVHSTSSYALKRPTGCTSLLGVVWPQMTGLKLNSKTKWSAVKVAMVRYPNLQIAYQMLSIYLLIVFITQILKHIILYKSQGSI